MDLYTDIIARACTNPDTLSADDFAALRSLSHSCPASPLAPAILLKYCHNLPKNEETDYRARVALYAGNPEAVISYIDPSGLGWSDFYPAEQPPATPSTENVIDTFLETYGHRSAEEDALLERMIFNPVPDYGETLLRDETPAPPSPHPAGSQDALIDSFLARNPAAASAEPEPEPHPVDTRPKAARPAPPAPPQPSQDSLLSESLAKIFIKQHRYERAYEIISNLSLNYPKKSVYFADQLRFLQKLIKIQQQSERNNNQ